MPHASYSLRKQDHSKRDNNPETIWHSDRENKRMNPLQHLRFLTYRSYLPVGWMVTSLIARMPGMVCTRTKNLKLVGPKTLVDQSLEVLADFETASPDLRAELDAKGLVTVLYCPLFQKDVSYCKYFLLAINPLFGEDRVACPHGLDCIEAKSRPPKSIYNLPGWLHRPKIAKESLF